MRIERKDRDRHASIALGFVSVKEAGPRIFGLSLRQERVAQFSQCVISQAGWGAGGGVSELRVPQGR